MSNTDFVSAFLSANGLELKDRSFLRNQDLTASFFETVLASQGHAVKISIGSKYMRVIGAGIEMDTTIHEIIPLLEEAGTDLELWTALDHVGHVFLKNMQPTYQRKKVLLAFMNQQQADELVHGMEVMRDGRKRPTEEMPILYRQYGDLYVSPVVDVEEGRVCVTEKMCQALGTERNELFDVGLQNVRYAFESGQIKIDSQGHGVSKIDSETPPASSLFLLSEFWEDQTRKLGAPPVVRIVHGDTLMFAPSDRPEAVERITSKYDIGAMHGLVPQPIEPQAFLWSGGTFVKFQAAA